MSKIKRLREQEQNELREIKLIFETFCLNPNINDYLRITTNIKFQNIEENYNLWRLAVINKYKYEEIGGLTDNKDQFITIKNKIIEKIKEKITLNLYLKIWAMFYATGEYEYLSIAYQSMISGKYCDIYLNIKEKYKISANLFNIIENKGQEMVETRNGTKLTI